MPKKVLLTSHFNSYTLNYCSSSLSELIAVGELFSSSESESESSLPSFAASCQKVRNIINITIVTKSMILNTVEKKNKN